MRSCTARFVPLAARLVRATLAAALLAIPRGASSQTADNVLVVINENSPASIQIGEYYAMKRGLAPDHVLRLTTATTEAIPRSEYDATIDAPIGAWLTRHALQDRVLYIVLTKGIPLRIVGTAGREATTASVDSELTLLYRRLLRMPTPILGRVPNPYYLDARGVADARPFARIHFDIYLTTRLDGFTVEDVMGLIDRGLAPSDRGKIVLDEKATVFDAGGDHWLREAANRLHRMSAGDRVVSEKTRAVAATTDPVIGYYSWGSNDSANRLRRYGLTFSPGALAGLFVSTDGRTFNEPPPAWLPSDPNGRTFAGSFQSLTGDLIRAGITGAAGHVSEPYLDATIRPQILFPAYVAGFNLAESFYLAMPYLSWQSIVIGDPLCAPFSAGATASDQIAGELDEVTGQPALFVERRLALLGPRVNREAGRLFIRMEAELRGGVTGNLEPLLVRATELDERFVDAHMSLASFYAERGDVDRAVERLRRVARVAPDHVIALNDLAWLLAVRQQQPKEALPFAERAFRLAPRPEILDTLGWIHHLLGDPERASGYIERALAAAPYKADVLIHAAIVHAAQNYKARARAELVTALKIDPTLAARSDVRALQAALE